MAAPSFSPWLGWRHDTPIEFLATGLDSVDALTGGCPRGRITEITGPASSGRTSLLHQILAAASSRGEYCAVVDAADSFDPSTASASGVDLDTLVWVRCGGRVDHAMKSADLLLHSGGFSVIALDLCDAAPESLRRIPVSWWHRFRRAVEASQPVLVVLAPEPQTRACASLAAQMERRQSGFLGAPGFRLLTGAEYWMVSRKPMRPQPAVFAVRAVSLKPR